jgi:hypothetical protein
MFPGLIYAELIKYKRTIIPWLIGTGGLLVATTALLLVTTENPQVTWEVLAGKSLNFMNLLSLLLVAVFTGYVFVTE